MSRRKMELRKKMKVCGVTLQDVARQMPKYSYPQVCNILNKDLNEQVHAIAEKLCDENAVQLRSDLNSL